MAVVRELLIKWGFDVDEAPLKRLDAGISNISQSALMFGAALGTAATGIGYLLKEAGEIEQVEIAFETMTGSGEKAKKLMEDITSFAATTPFELKGLIESSKGLLAFGIESDKIVEKMTSLGNIAAGVGKDKLPTLVRSYGKIRTKGKATMEELNMMLEAGVPILDELAKNFGVNSQEIFKMVSTGKVGFAEVDNALKTMSSGNGKFANLMDKQSKSFLGIVSNIKDLIDQLVIAVGKDLLPVAKELGNEIITVFQANRKLIQQKAVSFFRSLFQFVVKAVRGIKDLSKSVMVLLSPFGGLETVLKRLGQLFLIFVAAKTLVGIGQIAMALKNVTLVTQLLSKALMVTNLTAAAIPLLIGAAIIALGLIIEDIITFFRGGESVIGNFINMFKDKFPNAFEATKSALLTGLDLILLPFKNIYEFVSGLINLITGDFSSAFENAKNILNNFFNLGSKIKDTFNKVIGLFGGGAKDIVASAEQVNNLNPTSAPASSGGINSQKNVNVNAPINVSVPEGTPPEMVGEKVKEGINQSLSQMLKDASRLSEPQVEF